MQEKNNNAIAIKDVLGSLISEISRQKVDDLSEVQQAWEQAVGSLGAYARIKGIKDGCLFVNVCDPASLYQLRLRQQTFLTRIRERCAKIEKIIFKIGQIT